MAIGDLSPKGFDTEYEAEIVRPSAPVAAFSEVGISGVNRWGGVVREEFLPNLLHPQCIKVYREMSMNDPTIGAILFVCDQLIRKSNWTVEAGDSTPEAEEHKTFVESCMHDMEFSWRDTITEILSMLPFGWSWHETVYKYRRGKNNNPKFNSQYNDGKIGWRKLPGRAQETLWEWQFAENGDVNAMVQVAPPDYKTRIIPFNKSLLFRTRPDKNNPEGRSLLRNAYRPWYYKKHIEEIEAIGIERDLNGLPVMTTPDGVDIWNPNDSRMTDVRTRAENLVSRIRRDTAEGIVLPFGWVLALVSSSGSRTIDTNNVINRYDNRIAVTLLADIVLMGSDKVGSFALADIKKSLLASALESFAKSIADVFNKFAIPRLLDINGISTEKPPKITPGEIESPDLYELADYLRSLQDLGLQIFPDRVLEKYVRAAGDLPEKHIDEGYEIDPPKPGEDTGEGNTGGDSNDPSLDNQSGGAGFGSRNPQTHNNANNKVDRGPSGDENRRDANRIATNRRK
jgi:hypothetical protein